MSWFGLFSDPLPINTPAPDFTLSDHEGHSVALRELHGNTILLVFYPGDDTPVCTKQFCELRDHYALLRERSVVVLGINPGNAESHAKFRSRYGIPFPLLVDEGQRVAKLYHADGLMVRRTVYLIGPDSLIRHAQRGRPTSKELLAHL